MQISLTELSCRALVTCALLEGLCMVPVTADQVIADDLIVTGSIATGFDAVNGEAFGFDTLRLKENNLRIHFDDTSASGGFAANDWRIVINDTISGGKNYFAVEDSTAARQLFVIEAGAKANTLVVDSNSRIGVNTADPVVDIHSVRNDTPTLRLEQDGSSGVTAQAWDMAGNESNFFIRDVTNGSKLPFRIVPNAPTSSLYVAANGNIGLGTASPDGDLHVVATTGQNAAVVIGPNDIIPSATLHVDGTAFFSQTITVGSTRESKEKIRELTLDEAMDTLHGLNPVHFHYIEDPEAQLGFIAEEVPDLVATPQRKSVRPMDFVAVLTKVVKEHERRERDLMKTVEEQSKRIEELAKRLEAMEAAPPDRR